MKVYIINSITKSYILNIKIRSLVTEYALLVKLVDRTSSVHSFNPYAYFGHSWSYFDIQNLRLVILYLLLFVTYWFLLCANLIKIRSCTSSLLICCSVGDLLRHISKEEQVRDLILIRLVFYLCQILHQINDHFTLFFFIICQNKRKKQINCSKCNNLIILHDINFPALHLKVNFFLTLLFFLNLWFTPHDLL